MFTPYINNESSNFSYIELLFKKHIESDLPILKDSIPFKGMSRLSSGMSTTLKAS